MEKSMIIVSLITLCPTIAVWLLMLALRDKDDKMEKVYTDGIVVGYETLSRYTGLTLRFQWNGDSVRCGSDQVDRNDFPEGSKVNIYYFPNIMKRPTFTNNDRISGIVHVNDPKYI